MTVWNEIQDMPGEIYDPSLLQQWRDANPDATVVSLDWEAGVREHVTNFPDDTIEEVCDWVEQTHCPVDREMEDRILEIMLEEVNHHQLDSWDEV